MRFKSFIVLTSVFFFFVTIVNASTKYSGGNGDSNNPYKIANAQDLIDIGNPDDFDKNFILDANIDLT